MESDIFDPNYVKKQQTASLRRMAAEQNALRVERFNQARADWIATNVHNRDLGLPITAVPIVPKRIVVDDEGEWTEVPFADLSAPVLPPAVPPQTGNPLTKLNPQAETDRHAQLLAVLTMLNSKLDTLLLRG